MTNPDTQSTVEGHVVEVPLAYYEWLSGIQTDVRVHHLTPHEIAELIAALSTDSGLIKK
tara:strand:+ start:301 stop:477 length:177 start_codon:yes stop_codon:yes gene_type:complete